MPVLPEIALRVSEMLRHGELPVAQYVALLNKDPALSIEVLKTANSAFYGGATRSANLQEAVIRVGLARLQAILMIAHLKSKVLKGASFFGKADLLLEMSLPMAFLGSKLATNRRTQPDLCFTRGMLMHVEHLVIFGTIADISREHRHAISPSVAAMHQAFDLYGPEIRHAVASSWKLTDILIGEKGQTDFALEYTGLRQALVCRWLNKPLPELPRVDAEHLVETMTHIHPRIPES